MTLTRAIAAFNALRSRLNRSPSDRMIMQCPEWLELRAALSNEVVKVNAERASVQESLPRRGLEAVT